MLESLGFEALATTGAGYAWSRGSADLSVGRASMMAYLRDICAATGLPVSADLQNGFGDAPEVVHGAIVEAAQTGIVGASRHDPHAAGVPGRRRRRSKEINAILRQD
ncbi:isocitrate lyase/phosphoenolpyruvate mutase family protein [Undibacterium arcticum]